MLLGVALWACVHAGGLHATLAGVVLALFIPTRPPPNLSTLIAQANTIVAAEARRGGEVLRHGPSLPALRALDAIHDRLESPADRLLRHAGARSSYLVLPLFALANAGVAITPDVCRRPSVADAGDHGRAGDRQATRIGRGVRARGRARALPSSRRSIPGASWRGAGALAGIGFTMSLFIAGQAFPAATDFAAAKIAVFGASVLSSVIGVALLWSAGRVANDDSAAAARS